MSLIVRDAGRMVSRSSIVLSILLIILGLLAIASPVASSLGVAIVLGWLILFDGFVQLGHAFQSKGVGNIVWKVLVAAFYLFAGIYLLFRPARGVLGLTLALGILFVAEGVVALITYLWTPGRRSGWLLADGLIALVLGLLIWAHWPWRSFWILGTFAGIAILMNGITRLMMALAFRARFRRDHPEIQQGRAAA
jgi:uncharacterized membrane protein HdeD (DUF308 family)